MRVGMVRMDLTRRLDAHRVLSLTVSFLALVGWGAFAYSVGSSASAERDLRAELAQSKAAQDQLQAERDQQQAAVGELTQVQAKLVSARDGSIPLLRNGSGPRRKSPLFSRRYSTSGWKPSGPKYRDRAGSCGERTSKAKSKT